MQNTLASEHDYDALKHRIEEERKILNQLFLLHKNIHHEDILKQSEKLDGLIADYHRRKGKGVATNVNCGE